jgi:hypothetical protein
MFDTPLYKVDDTVSLTQSWNNRYTFHKVVAVTKTTVTLDNGKKFSMSTGKLYGNSYSSDRIYLFHEGHVEANRRDDENKQFREMKRELEDTLKNKGVSFDKLKKIMEIIKE